MGNRQRQRGNTLVEFTLAGIPVIFLLCAVVQLSVAMWNYHTLAYTVKEAARYTSVRGQGCTTNGNTCSATVGMIATQFQSTATGIPASAVNVTLTTASGSSKSCTPLTQCLSDSTVWPPSANNDNVPGKNVTISAKYVISSGIRMYWPGAGISQIGVIAMPATSTQPIVF